MQTRVYWSGLGFRATKVISGRCRMHKHNWSRCAGLGSEPLECIKETRAPSRTLMGDRNLCRASSQGEEPSYRPTILAPDKRIKLNRIGQALPVLTIVLRNEAERNDEKHHVVNESLNRTTPRIPAVSANAKKGKSLTKPTTSESFAQQSKYPLWHKLAPTCCNNELQLFLESQCTTALRCLHWYSSIESCSTSTSTK